MNVKRLAIIVSTTIIILAIIVVAYHLGQTDGRSAAADSGPISTVADTTGQETTAPAARFNVTGVWYSNRKDYDTLTMMDGKYKSSDWLTPGTYELSGDVVILKDQYGEQKELHMVTEAGKDILLFDNGKYSHCYYRDQPETAPQESILSNDAAAQSLAIGAAQQILTTGTWISDNGNTDMTFTATDYTMTYKGMESQTRTYKIQDVILKDGDYVISWDIGIPNEFTKTDTVQSGTATIHPNESGYTITGAENFVYAYVYHNKADIIFTDPTECDSPEPVTETTGIRNDNPDNTDKKQEMFSQIDMILPGTWRGCLEDVPTDDSLYYTFTFHSDGTYIYSYGNTTEQGTFDVQHDSSDIKYPSSITLTHDGIQDTVRFYITDSPLMLFTDNVEAPAYTKTKQ